MDPDATYAIAVDANRDTTERIDAVEALVSWINRGGFAPKAMTYARQLADLRSTLYRLRSTELIEEMARCDFMLGDDATGVLVLVACDAPAPHCIGGTEYRCDEHENA